MLYAVQYARQQAILFVLLRAIISIARELWVIEIGVEYKKADSVKAVCVKGGAPGGLADVFGLAFDQIVIAQCPMGAGMADVEKGIQVGEGRRGATAAIAKIAS